MPDGMWELRFEDDLKLGLDPRLQFLLLKAAHGASGEFGVAPATEDADLDVVVRLTEEDAPIPPMLTNHRRYGDIVVGRVRLSRVIALKRSQSVRSLKAAPPVRSGNEFATRSLFGRFVTNGRQGWPTGKGVVVGIVDYGCDFRHPNFRHRTAPFGSRIEAIWEQAIAPTGGARSPARFGYGSEHDRATIARALAETPSGPLAGYRPLANYFTDEARGEESGAHGTRVMDIAAGNGAGTGSAGIAPEADIVFVQLPRLDWQGLGEFANSVHILDAVAYIFERAGDRPAVVNISLSTNGGPHDGTNPVELGLDRLLRGRNRAVVIAAGNEGHLPIHVDGVCGPGRPLTMDWIFPPFGRQNPKVSPELEVWYPADAELDFVVTPSGANALPPVRRDQAAMLRLNGAAVGAVIHRSKDPNNGENQLTILLEPAAARGAWKIDVVHRGGRPAPVHAWVERQMFGDPSLHPKLMRAGVPIGSSFKVGSLACGKRTICVGASTNLAGSGVAEFSSGGPTRIGDHKPDLCAPGSPVLAAMHDHTSLRRLGSGTSFAAPMVAGAVALMFEAAARNGRQLEATEIATILRETAAPLPGQREVWEPGAGFGELRIPAALARLGWPLVGDQR